MLLLQILDFFVGVFHDLVLNFHVLHVGFHFIEVFLQFESCKTLVDCAQLDTLEDHPEPIAWEFFVRIPFGRFPAFAVAFGGPSRQVALGRTLLVGHVGALDGSSSLSAFLVLSVDVVIVFVALDHPRVQGLHCSFLAVLPPRLTLLHVV